MKLLVGIILCAAYVNCETFIECNGKSEKTFIAGKNCQSYIFCDGENSYEGSCPSEMAFNFDDLTCDEPENVQCGDGMNVPTTPSTMTPTKETTLSSKKPIPEKVTKQHPTPPGKPLKPKPVPGVSTPKGRPSPPVPPRRPLGTSKPNSIPSRPGGVAKTTLSKLFSSTLSPKRPPIPTKKPSTVMPMKTGKPISHQKPPFPYLPLATGAPNSKVPTPPGPSFRDGAYFALGAKMPSQTNSSGNVRTANKSRSYNAKEMCLRHSVGSFAYADDCRYYYLCIQGKLSKQECPMGYGWDDKAKTCSLSACTNKNF